MAITNWDSTGLSKRERYRRAYWRLLFIVNRVSPERRRPIRKHIDVLSKMLEKMR